ncbi:MAG: hypothetical protein HW403_1120, partial [Dehalococcoidia bacterium]|nr:hypothetical protein [Dehalococcoidia bacterium]
ACNTIGDGAGAAASESLDAPSSKTKTSPGKSSGEAPQIRGSTQTNQGGQVTIKVSWGGPEAGPVFQVAMDTHSVDLDGYDLAQLGSLRTGKGQEVRPIKWDAPRGEHHREGTLVFPEITPDGNPLIGPAAGVFELIIRDVAGIPERVFRWQD